jgi:hypothetical protein
MPRLLVTAEAFGFGPASKLHAICLELARRGFENHYVGQDVSLTFVQANRRAFASVVPVKEMSELAAVLPDGIDAAVSVMDPYLALWAGIHGVPCVYVDSLYWLWRWSAGEEAELQATAAALLSCGEVDAAFRRLSAIPMHNSQYVAHSLSTVTCAQRSPATVDRAGRVQGHRRVEVIDAIVDLSHREPATPSAWLATTSGLLNPLIPIELAVRWLQISMQMIDEAARLSGSDEPVTLAGNPDVLEHAANVSDHVYVVPLDHHGTLRAMSTAIACITPPGLTTMLECAAYGTPLIFLPEQHYGHIRNYREISQCGAPGIFPQSLLDTRVSRQAEQDVMAETRLIMDQLTLHFDKRDDVWSDMVEAMAWGMEKARRNRAVLHMAQEAAIRAFVGGYSGVSQIAGILESLLELSDKVRASARKRAVKYGGRDGTKGQTEPGGECAHCPAVGYGAHAQEQVVSRWVSL